MDDIGGSPPAKRIPNSSELIPSFDLYDDDLYEQDMHSEEVRNDPAGHGVFDWNADDLYRLLYGGDDPWPERS